MKIKRHTFSKTEIGITGAALAAAGAAFITGIEAGKDTPPSNTEQRTIIIEPDDAFYERSPFDSCSGQIGEVALRNTTNGMSSIKIVTVLPTSEGDNGGCVPLYPGHVSRPLIPGSVITACQTTETGDLAVSFGRADLGTVYGLAETTEDFKTQGGSIAVCDPNIKLETPKSTIIVDESPSVSIVPEEAYIMDIYQNYN